MHRYLVVYSLCLLFFTNQNLVCSDRRSSAPYISGDTFRAYADFIIDETNQAFSAEKVQPGSVIFVKTDYLNNFFHRIHPLIASPYILISHNSDDPIPGDFTHMLDEEKLIVWFGQNVDNYVHPKLHPIPIGIANRYVAHGNVELLDEVRNAPSANSNDILLYMNFSISTYYKERLHVYNLFARKRFCLYSTNKNFQAYLNDVRQSKFVLSPRGNGLDCHRTWEALYMGAFPIVRSSSLDSLYENLPVIIVSNWKEVTETFLKQKYEEMKTMEFAFDKLNSDFWFRLIDSYKLIPK